MTRGAIQQQRWWLTLLLLALNALLLAALVLLAIMGIAVGVEGVLYMAAGTVLGWGGSAVVYYFGTSEGSSRKTDILMGREEGEA